MIVVRLVIIALVRQKLCSRQQRRWVGMPIAECRVDMRDINLPIAYCFRDATCRQSKPLDAQARPSSIFQKSCEHRASIFSCFGQFIVEKHNGKCRLRF